MVILSFCFQAIRGYRETEKSSWNESNSLVITRLKAISVTAVPGKVAVPLEQVHVLDLAEDGVIEPHVDSIKVGHIPYFLEWILPSSSIRTATDRE